MYGIAIRCNPKRGGDSFEKKKEKNSVDIDIVLHGRDIYFKAELTDFRSFDMSELTPTLAKIRDLFVDCSDNKLRLTQMAYMKVFGC